MPILKKPNAASKTTVKTPTFEEGDKVVFLVDDTEVSGTIVSIDKKAKTASVDGEDGNSYECELNELKKVPDEQPEQPKKAVKFRTGKPDKETKGKSLGGIFAKAKVAADGGGGGFPEGNWEGILIGTEIKEEEGKTLGYLKYVGVNDPDIEGKTQRVRYELLDGEDEGQGMEFFKRDIAKLGADIESIQTTEDLEAVLQGLEDEQPWVDLTAKKQKDNPQFTNLYLDGMKEDQSDKPEVPA